MKTQRKTGDLAKRERTSARPERPLRFEALEPRLALDGSTGATDLAVEPSFLIEKESLLDGSAIALDVQAYSRNPVATWRVDWGDGSTTETNALGDSASFYHCFPDSSSDATYLVTLTTVDSEGEASEEPYELATIDVPATLQNLNFQTDVFYDAEKGNYAQSKLCWAAGAANALVYSGWADSTITVDQGGTSVSFDDEDDVYEYFVANFDNTGSSALYAFEWFITGDYDPMGVSGWAEPTSGSGGFYASADIDNYLSFVHYYSYRTNKTPEAVLPTVATYLRDGSGVCVSLAFYSGNVPGSTVTLAHTVTLWGYERDLTYDPSDPRSYAAIIVSDSDNDAYKGRNAPNTTATVRIEWSSTYNRYQLVDYRSGKCWLEECIVVEPKSSVLPSAAVLDPNAIDAAFEEARGDASALLAELDEDDLWWTERPK
ncbi:MAG: hypothetical protein IJM30_07480 [Thermoguttaceae bacterium]|nr:hypothetical protein [Thermoguttaceae bacterium]